MTWAPVAQQSTSYGFPSDSENNYVVVGYVEDGYIQPEGIWTTVAGVSTTWTPS